MNNCVLILIFISAIFPSTSQANFTLSLTHQEIAAKNFGHKEGIFSDSSEKCSLKVGENLEGHLGEYQVWFYRPGWYSGVSTADVKLWTVDIGNRVLTYQKKNKNVIAHFYFDEDLLITSYYVEGDSRGRCRLR